VGGNMKNDFVKIKNGVHRSKPVTNAVFPLLKGVSFGKRGAFVTVDASALMGAEFTKIRVLVDSPSEVIPATEQEYTNFIPENMKPQKKESKKQAMDRIAERFNILDEMTDAVANGVVRGLIVSGPPGVGKSFGVETILEEYDAMAKIGGKVKTEIVKGSMTPIGLYQTLYNNADAGNILVFDDCDSVLFDEVCLNMLKAVLDSGKKRTISWKAESQALRREGIPDRFEFKGGCIFITNVNFEHVRSKKIKDHLAALMSRCHYIDLGLDTIDDKFLRIDQIIRDGMLQEYGYSAKFEKEIVDFMHDNAPRLREISLRMVLKIADLAKMNFDNWKGLARSTCMTRFDI
tara:strand:+ start:1035 stop:2075 length:1041 start_codon:yes stop_codon:yes gene_type:complete